MKRLSINIVAILLAFLIYLLSATNIHGQNALKMPRTDNTRSIVFCYIKLYTRMVDLKKKKEKGYIKVQILDKHGIKSWYYDEKDSVYVLRDQYTNILGAYYEYTTPPLGKDPNIKMQIISYDTGYILVFTNIPPGFFNITKLQTWEEKSSETWREDCKSCINMSLSKKVSPSEVNFMGCYQINAYFKDCYYQEFIEIGKVIVQNLITAPNENGYIMDQNLNEYIQLNEPSQTELIKIISKKASGDWGMMLNKFLIENSQ